MKTVYTFIMITFALSAILYLAGIGQNTSDTTVSGWTGLIPSPAQILIGLFNGTGTVLLYASIVGVIILLMIAISGVNSFTGGNASVGITAGYALFAVYCSTLLADFINVINVIGDKCVQNAALQCTNWTYWVAWVYGGLLIVGFAFALIDLVGGND
jgi:hypothetical protein